jgi:hypothetical protein
MELPQLRHSPPEGAIKAQESPVKQASNASERPSASLTKSDESATTATDKNKGGTLRDNSADAIESALASALERAALAGRFDVVAQLAEELRARRLAREGVADIAAEGRRR